MPGRVVSAPSCRCAGEPGTVPGEQEGRALWEMLPLPALLRCQGCRQQGLREGGIRSIKIDPVTLSAAGSSFEACLQCGHSPRTRFHLLPDTHRPSPGQQPPGTGEWSEGPDSPVRRSAPIAAGLEAALRYAGTTARCWGPAPWRGEPDGQPGQRGQECGKTTTNKPTPPVTEKEGGEQSFAARRHPGAGRARGRVVLERAAAPAATCPEWPQLPFPGHRVAVTGALGTAAPHHPCLKLHLLLAAELRDFNLLITLCRGGAGRAQEECLEVSSAQRGWSPSCPHPDIPTVSFGGTSSSPACHILPGWDWNKNRSRTWDQGAGPQPGAESRPGRAGEGLLGLELPRHMRL